MGRPYQRAARRRSSSHSDGPIFSTACSLARWIHGFTLRLLHRKDGRGRRSEDNLFTAELGARPWGEQNRHNARNRGSARRCGQFTCGRDDHLEFHLKEPCGQPLPNTKTLTRSTSRSRPQPRSAPVSGKLTTPTQAALEDWIKTCPGSQDWIMA